MEKNCQYCQKVFTANRRDVLYCSRTCRQMTYMHRRITGLIADAKKEKVDVLNHDLRSETTIDILNERPLSNVPEEQYKPLESEFLVAIYKHIDEGESGLELDACLNRHDDLTSRWVSLRFKCLLECLLLFADMKAVMLGSLMEVCNAFILLTRSEHYKNLPGSYPYSDQIFKLKERLKKLCKKVHQSDSIKFYLSREDKIELIAMRYELAQCVPRRKFRQLEFKE